MPSIKDAAGELVTSRRIAVTGVSGTPENHASNVVYKRPRERGYEVIAVNPNVELRDHVLGPVFAAQRPRIPIRLAHPGGVEAMAELRRHDPRIAIAGDRATDE